MELFFITNSPQEAVQAEKAGIERIFIDLESLGKAERQRGWNTYLSDHTLKDVPPVRAAVKEAQVMVRVNPPHEGTKNEVDHAVESGADWIMLPMFTSADQVRQVAVYIDGRAKLVPLVETAAAMTRLEDVLRVEGVDEIHIGLSDLSISMGLSFLFEPLAYGLVDWMAQMLNGRQIPWGVGGVARVGQGAIPPELILSEHARLGSSRVILSRAFRRKPDDISFDLEAEIRKLRAADGAARKLSPEQMERNRELVAKKVKEMSAGLQRGVCG